MYNHIHVETYSVDIRSGNLCMYIYIFLINTYTVIKYIYIVNPIVNGSTYVYICIYMYVYICIYMYIYMYIYIIHIYYTYILYIFDPHCKKAPLRFDQSAFAKSPQVTSS